MKLKPVVAAAALALGMVGSALAVNSIDIGTVGAAPVAINAPATTPEENWGWVTFTLDTPFNAVTGSFTGDTALTLYRAELWDPSAEPWVVIDDVAWVGDEPRSFFFDGLTGGNRYKLEYMGSAGATGTITAVPEPELWLGLASGLGLLGWARRRQQKQG
jgi:hypothetical protein